MRARRAVESSLHRPSSWLLAGSGLILYLWAPTLLAGEDLGPAAAAPWWLPVVAPPLLYTLLLLGLSDVPAARRLAGMLALCAGHVALGLVTPAIHQAAGLVAPPDAFDARPWAVPAVPVIQLLSVPLALFPLRDLLIWPRRRVPRAGRRRAAADVTPTPAPSRAGRGWDDLSPHTVGGERLHEESRPQITPAVRPLRREPARPISWPPDPTPPPATSAVPARRPLFEVRPAPPAPEERRGAELPATLAAGSPITEPLRRPEVTVTAPATSELVRLDPAMESESTAVTEPPEVEASGSVVARVEEAASLPIPLPPAVVEPVAVPPLTVASPLAEENVVAPAPPVADPTPGADIAVDTGDLASLLAPVGPLAIETRTLMGIALCTACPPGLEEDAVVQAAFRFLSFLAEGPGARTVTQATIHGATGAMVLTPLGPLASGGPVLAAAIPRRGALALLEILSLRIAGEYRAARAPAAGSPASTGQHEASPSSLGVKPVPARVEVLARSVTAGAPLRPLCLEDPTGRLVLYLLLAEGVEAGPVARLASDLYRVMQVDDEPGGVGPFQSAVVRLGSQRVVVRPVAEKSDRSAVLVAAGPREDRPGLARLQLERVAARLAVPPA